MHGPNELNPRRIRAAERSCCPEHFRRFFGTALVGYPPLTARNSKSRRRTWAGRNRAQAPAGTPPPSRPCSGRCHFGRGRTHPGRGRARQRGSVERLARDHTSPSGGGTRQPSRLMSTPSLRKTAVPGIAGSPPLIETTQQLEGARSAGQRSPLDGPRNTPAALRTRPRRQSPRQTMKRGDNLPADPITRQGDTTLLNVDALLLRRDAWPPRTRSLGTYHSTQGRRRTCGVDGLDVGAD